MILKSIESNNHYFFKTVIYFLHHIRIIYALRIFRFLLKLQFLASESIEHDLGHPNYVKLISSPAIWDIFFL